MSKVPPDLFYYQRTDANGRTECAERCVDDWHYCKSALLVPETGKFLCQLYGASLEHFVPLNSQHTGDITLIELTDPPCSSKFSLDASALLVQSISPMAKQTLAMIPRPSEQRKFFHEPQSKTNDETDMTLSGGRKRKDEHTIWADDNKQEFNDQRSKEWKEVGKKGSATERQTIVDEDKIYSTGLPTRKIDDEQIDRIEEGEAKGEQQREKEEKGQDKDRRDNYRIGPSKWQQSVAPIQPKYMSRVTADWQTMSGCRAVFCPPFRHHVPCAAQRSVDPCAPQAHWLEWTVGSCSVTCGQGMRERRRYCSTGTQTDCAGEDTETERCVMPACNQWGDWTEWARCSVSCGGGKQTRQRICRNGDKCKGAAQESRPCNEQPCPTWAEWSDWSHCSASCGTGIQKRRRECVPDEAECNGKGAEVRECELRACPSWSEWEPWSSCSKSCGNGESIRCRECTNGLGDECKGPAVEHLLCNTQPCPAWTPWTEWSVCTKSCGKGGTKLRSRQCRYNGLPNEQCQGPAQDQMECGQKPCPIWGEWSNWTECSTTCGHGQQQRSRECRPNGFGCAGGDREVRFCQRAVCPYFDNWTEWSGCSVTCGLGFCERRRRCIKDADLGGNDDADDGEGEGKTRENAGHELATTLRHREGIRGAQEKGKGEEEEERTSEMKEGAWRRRGQSGAEEDITAHSLLSAQTLQVAQSAIAPPVERRRSPTKFPKSHLRDNSTQKCIGPEVERKSCDAGPCCEWSAWSAWSDCQVVRCGNAGHRKRTRMCELEGVGREQQQSYNTGWKPAGRFGIMNDFLHSHSYNSPRSPFGGGYSNADRRQCSICPGKSHQIESCAIPADAESTHCGHGGGGGEERKKGRQKAKNKENDEEIRGGGRGGGNGQVNGEEQGGAADRDTYASFPTLLMRDDNPSAKMLRKEMKKNTGEKEEEKHNAEAMRRTATATTEGQRKLKKVENNSLENVELEEDCYWTEWMEWSTCEPNMLARNRSRMCVGLRALVNGCQCPGHAVEQNEDCLLLTNTSTTVEQSKELQGTTTTTLATAMATSSSQTRLANSLIKRLLLIPRHSHTKKRLNHHGGGEQRQWEEEEEEADEQLEEE